MIIVTLSLLLIKTFFFNKKPSFNRAKKPQEQHEHINHFKARKKPDWVIQEVLKIKAQSPELSCRLISYVFNRRFAGKNESVGKTFVSYTIRSHLYEIQQLRRKWRNKQPHKVKFNHYWGMDMTFVDNKPVLGITEHRSRQLLGLIPLSNKSSINIIKQLIRLFHYSDKPKTIRVDNEVCFNSSVIKLFLKILNIKHQAIEKHCPWQNGRIERLFGTFKSNIKGMDIKASELPLVCYHFQQWYNAIRPHQSLNGKTPEEVYWNQVQKRYKY